MGARCSGCIRSSSHYAVRACSVSCELHCLPIILSSENAFAFFPPSSPSLSVYVFSLSGDNEKMNSKMMWPAKCLDEFCLQWADLIHYVSFKLPPCISMNAVSTKLLHLANQKYVNPLTFCHKTVSHYHLGGNSLVMMQLGLLGIFEEAPWKYRRLA